MRSAATAIIVVIIWILHDIGSAIQRLLNAIILVISRSATVAHISHILVELVRVEVGLISHHLRERLDRTHLTNPELVLSRAPVHHQVRIIVEDYGGNNVIAAKISNEVHSSMTGHFPTMSAHRPTDIQSKQNSVVLHHGLLRNSLGLHGHVVHGIQVLVGVDWSIEHACVGSDSMEHLRDVRMSNVMILSVDSSRHHQISQRLSIRILDIYPQNDDLEVSNIHVLSQIAEQFVSLLVAGIAVGVMAICDENVHEKPIVRGEVFFQKGVELHHKAVSVEKCVSHCSTTMRVDVPYFPWG